jgi:uncharacterized protein YjbI with pentapeptide repeats
MPPEQMFNRQLTKASDLYSLGATLICLLTQTPSAEIGKLIDETNRINFKSLVSNISPQFVDWLEKMVEPSLKNRYSDAATALKALEPIDVVNFSLKPARRINNTNLSAKTTTFLLINFTLVGFAVGTQLISSNSRVKPVLINNHKVDVRTLLESHQCQNCNLKGANLRNANLRGVDLSSADLRDADLRSADLTNADLTDADLRNADLRKADLKSADLANADLTDADLRKANLRGVSLNSANLTNADIRNTNLNSADLRGATMPNGFIYENE